LQKRKRREVKIEKHCEKKKALKIFIVLLDYKA